MTLNPSDAKTIANLMKELATEIDLHNEDIDLPAAEPAITALRHAGDMLKRAGVEQPEACVHLIGRYAKATGCAQ